MKIALFHNYYKIPGGEDKMFELEVEALRELGHEVFPYVIRNEDIVANASTIEKARIAWKAIYNKTSYAEVSKFLLTHSIDIGHVHNWFPVLSPSIYDAHQDLSIPVVQTLHNYRLGCANGTFRRNGESCTLCLNGSRYNAVTKRCYRNSALGSFAWKRLIDKGWKSGSFTEQVSAYVSPSKEVAAVHEKIGLPSDKITVLPNACFNPKFNEQNSHIKDRSGGLYLGRLVHEKGVDTLVNAWEGIESNLQIVGSGPDSENLKQLSAANPNIEFLGQLSHKEAYKKLSESGFLVFPSRWAEPFGLGIIEAMAAGIPVIASDLGAPSEIVKHGVTGLLVPPDDPRFLHEAITQMVSNPTLREHMGRAARNAYLENYQSNTHAKKLVRLYSSLLPSGDQRN